MFWIIFALIACAAITAMYYFDPVTFRSYIRRFLGGF